LLSGATVMILASCQLVGEYESFESSPGGTTSSGGEAGGTAVDPCAGLDSSKLDPRGLSTLVLVRQGQERCSWVDRTEVTTEQYRQFMDATDPPLPDPERCLWKSEFSPGVDGTSECATEARSLQNDAGAPDLPARCVDWCDAEAFCRWQGKRLCYTNIGASALWEGPRILEEWGAACSGPAEQPLPYGETGELGVCNIDNQAYCDAYFQTCAALPPGAFEDCGYQGGPVDMIGNVSEWVFACARDDGTGPVEDEPCFSLGGSFDDALDDVTCFTRLHSAPRGALSPARGFRCCMDLTLDEELAVGEAAAARDPH